MVVVRTHNAYREEFFLRGTIWTRDVKRAGHYDTSEAAWAALQRAKKFTRAADWKAAQVIDITLLPEGEIEEELSTPKRTNPVPTEQQLADALAESERINPLERSS